MLNYFTGTGKCALSAYRCRFLLFICLGLMRVCLSSSTSGGFSTVLLPARVFARLLIVADWIVMHTDWVLPKTANVKDRKGLWKVLCCPMHDVILWVSHWFFFFIVALMIPPAAPPEKTWFGLEGEPSWSPPIWIIFLERCVASPPD